MIHSCSHTHHMKMLNRKIQSRHTTATKFYCRSVRRKSEGANTFISCFCYKGTQSVMESEEFEEADRIAKV